MARLPRFIIPGQPQHVIQRGNNRDPVFVSEDDYLFYRDKLVAACNKHKCEICAYVFMTNHVHLLITPQTDQGISKVMQMLGRYYVQYFNYTYQRTGHRDRGHCLLNNLIDAVQKLSILKECASQHARPRLQDLETEDWLIFNLAAMSVDDRPSSFVPR